VSHAREFVNNVVTSTLVFEGEGTVREYVGGYDDWVRQRKQETPAAPGKPAAKQERPRDRKEKPRKLTFREQKELDDLPLRIEALEAEQQKLHGDMADPNFYRESGGRVTSVRMRLEELEAELSAVYARWEELEALKEGP
jgi:ATP-binding cassette subfamily F protein uup